MGSINPYIYPKQTGFFSIAHVSVVIRVLDYFISSFLLTFKDCGCPAQVFSFVPQYPMCSVVGLWENTWLLPGSVGSNLLATELKPCQN